MWVDDSLCPSASISVRGMGPQDWPRAWSVLGVPVSWAPPFSGLNTRPLFFQAGLTDAFTAVKANVLKPQSALPPLHFSGSQPGSLHRACRVTHSAYGLLLIVSGRGRTTSHLDYYICILSLNTHCRGQMHMPPATQDWPRAEPIPPAKPARTLCVVLCMYQQKALCEPRVNTPSTSS